MKQYEISTVHISTFHNSFHEKKSIFLGTIKRKYAEM